MKRSYVQDEEIVVVRHKVNFALAEAHELTRAGFGIGQFCCGLANIRGQAGPPRSIIRRLVWFFSLLVLSCLADEMPSLKSLSSANYSVQRWEAGDEAGLPQNTVTTVVQTRDGYLWLGTYSGLARFDGARFTVFDDNNAPGLASSRVTSLFEASDGTLWIGHEAGEVSRYCAGRFETVPFQSPAEGGKIQDLGTDESGDLWVLNAVGTLIRVRDGLALKPEAGQVGTSASEAGQMGILVVFARSVQGTIWVGVAGRVSVLNGERLVPLDFSEADGNRSVAGIAANREGALWVAFEGRICKWTGTAWTESRPIPAERTSIPQLIETRQGDLLASGGQGFLLISPGAEAVQFHRGAGFPSDWVTSFCEDREGNYWTGTGGGGLAMVRRAIFRTVSPPDKWQGSAVLATCSTRDGTLWVGTEGAGLYRLQNGEWRNFSAKEGISNPYVWSLAEDSRDDLWVGTWSWGLLVRRGDRFERADGLEEAAPHMTAILSSARGGLWVGTGAGLMRYEDGPVRWYGREAKSRKMDVRTVTEAPDGTVWFGMSGGGLGWLQPDGQLRYYRRGDGLPSDYIGYLHLEADGTLWIGTLGGGLTRLKNGKFAVINRKSGLPNGIVCHIEDDGHGFFWISTYAGILRVSKRELNQCADGELPEVSCRTFGVADGLPTLECSYGLQSAGCKTGDGRLWFSTSRGLVTVNPAEIQTNALPTPTLIESMEVDDEPIAFSPGTEPIEIGPGRHRFQFRYTGLSFIRPEKLRFKYRLQGLDDDWITVGNVRTVNYNFIPPGRYVFEVLACNSDGIWGETPARLAFTLRPFFWQTATFHVAGGASSVLLAGGVVWFVMRQRMRRKLELLERQHEVEKERARIAHDIHDDLGAQLTRITMLSDSARDEQAEPNVVAEDLDQIYKTARDATSAMDEIVWAVNPKHDTLESLASYLEKFGFDFLDAAGIRCRLKLPGNLPGVRLTAEARHNLFLAYKEILHNIVKHSGASEVRITLDCEANEMKLFVEDNGSGFGLGCFENGVPRGPGRVATGNGLGNINRRVQEIGGICQIQSEPGRGTTVMIQLKLPPAELSRK